jgi:tRNA (Thr-GGU) A37 N-methylase
VEVHATGFVESRRTETEDDHWGGEQACIVLNAGCLADALEGLIAFSHVEVLFFFHQVNPARRRPAMRRNANGAASVMSYATDHIIGMDGCASGF